MYSLILIILIMTLFIYLVENTKGLLRNVKAFNWEKLGNIFYTFKNQNSNPR